MTGLRDFTPSLDGAEGLQDDALGRRFRAFHEDNPGVYEALVRLAREAKARGKKGGIALLFEVCRWELLLETEGGDDHRLNNSYRSRYARLIMAQEADLDGYFEVRKLKASGT